MDTYSLYAGQFLSFTEHFAPKGHNACAGCGVALAVRHVYKALEGTLNGDVAGGCTVTGESLQALCFL